MKYELTAEYVNDRNGQPLAVLDGFPMSGAELRSEDIRELMVDLGTVHAELVKRERATPEYIRQEEAKRQARLRAYEAALARPGFILVYFGFAQPLGVIRPCLHVGWLPETGPRWVHTDYGIGAMDVERMKMVNPRKSHSARKLVREWAKAIGEDSERIGMDHSLVAVHLLDDGPDRRAAYLARKNLEHTAHSTSKNIDHTAYSIGASTM